MRKQISAGCGLIEDLPVLAVCGWSGSGKTTLLEAVIPWLIERGLRVAAIKHDVHGADLDRRASDSARLFGAGADVHLRGPSEVLWRTRPEWSEGLEAAIDSLLARHDLVLVEGYKNTPLPKVWLASPSDSCPPEGSEGVIEVLPWGGGRLDRMRELLSRWLSRQWSRRPCYGGVLVGGASQRMGGRPKQSLRFHGVSLFERARVALEDQVDRIVVLGSGEVPESAAALERLPEAPGIGGPMAGMLAAVRWQARAAWVFVAADMPLLRAQAVAWLVGQRAPGRWMVLPGRGDSGVEPLCALYEPPAFPLLEELARRGKYAPRQLADHDSAWRPAPPADLADAWVNINTAEELEALESGGVV